jgi:YD repeat-containing protein
MNTKWEYDKFGRLSKIMDGDREVSYKYDAKSRLVEKTLPVGGFFEKYEYDLKGQLIAVKEKVDCDLRAQKADASWRIVEQYVYDPAGNMLIGRNETRYTIEPHANGGSPMLVSHGGTENTEVIFNDMLGSSLGTFSTHHSSLSSAVPSAN